MTETVLTLVLEFLDDTGKVAKVVIKNPKEELGYEEVMDVMNIIVDNGALLTSKGNALNIASKCYYRELTKILLAPTEGE